MSSSNPAMPHLVNVIIIPIYNGDLRFADHIIRARKTICLCQRKSVSSPVWLALNRSSSSANTLPKPGLGDERSGERMEGKDGERKGRISD